MRDQASITIPVKPYIYKYVSAIEGTPLLYTSRTLICTMMRRLINKNSDIKIQNQIFNLSALAPEHRTQEIEIAVPKRYRHEVVKVVDENVIMACNLFLNWHFKKALTQFVDINERTDTRYKGYKDIAYNFARLHNIIIEEDITYDSLVQTGFRMRKVNNNDHVFSLSCPFPGTVAVAI